MPQFIEADTPFLLEELNDLIPLKLLGVGTHSHEEAFRAAIGLLCALRDSHDEYAIQGPHLYFKTRLNLIESVLHARAATVSGVDALDGAVIGDAKEYLAAARVGEGTGFFNERLVEALLEFGVIALARLNDVVVLLLSSHTLFSNLLPSPLSRPIPKTDRSNLTPKIRPP